jgi:hypothetical protein
MTAPKIKATVEYTFFGGKKPEDVDTLFINEDAFMV